jgi:outer membrane immunogenic protein
MRHILPAVELVAALGVSGIACAAEPSGPPDWTGVYIGANVGGAWSETGNSLSIHNGDPNGYFFPPAIPGVVASGTQNFDSSSLTGGAQLGYNWQPAAGNTGIGNAVLGIEVDFAALDLEESEGGRFLYTTNNAPYLLTEQASTDWMVTVRPRIGLGVSRGLLYATGGLAIARFDFDQFFSEPPFTPTPEAASISENELGWTAGGGIEYSFNKNWSIKTEYLFARFDVDDATGVLANANGSSPLPGLVDSAAFINSLSDLDIHTLRAGINYKF